MARTALGFVRGRLALVFELRGAQLERKMCVRRSTVNRDIGAVVPELAAPLLSAISALRRHASELDMNWRSSRPRDTQGGANGASLTGRRHASSP